MWINVSEAMRITGKFRQNIWNDITKGRIRAKRSGHNWMVDQESLVAYYADKAKDQVIAGFADFMKYAGQEQAKILADVIQRAAERG